MKKWAFFFISILIIGLIILSYKYVEANTKAQNLQNSIDAKFKAELSFTRDSFNVKMNDYAYRSILSRVSTVASISEITSYEDQNDNLDISLYNLYVALNNDRSKEKVLSRADELRDIFMMLVTNPASKEATDKLMQINDETFFRD
ncbi:hypothetical protein [Paenibacillus herberti]|uniref:Uncharacterized protein n=1 Tax=Paenibacillus herberti TaxID=1619309 RepID=A0A229P178_9BACL|nr:hypothetical protein [Paenibacillus herberti]OXM15877.1 hypothetical protein CGZ75_03950 [Paenibacillus herberti]